MGNYIPYGRQCIEQDDIDAVMEVLQSDYLTIGPKVAEFEHAVADYTGAKHAVAAANGTAALHIACMAAGIGPGDEVITTPITFAASANCVLYCGAKPVFADIKADTYNIDPEQIEKKITKNTKAIIPVHFTGQPCEMDEITRIAKKHGLTVIEDAAHALGASYKNRKIGSISDMTILSFHPVKHITTAEGGMVLTDDDGLYKKLSLYRTHGITRNADWMEQMPDLEAGLEGAWYYQQTELGYNYRISDMQCALGITQMKKLERFVARRKEIAARYDEAFLGVDGIITPKQQESCDNSYHLYVIQVVNKPRRQVFDGLRTAGIGVNVHYIPVYKHPYYQHNGYDAVCCPNAEMYYSRAVSLPMYPLLTDEEQERVIGEVKRLCLD